MLKQIVKYGTIAGVIYGLYYLFTLFPVECSIVIGIGSVCVIGYWISQTY
jgi:hypothetical protein